MGPLVVGTRWGLQRRDCQGLRDEPASRHTPTHLVWATVCSLILAFFYVYLPETKGMRLEDVAHYIEEITAPKSTTSKPDDQTAFLSQDSSGIEIMT